MERAGNAFGKTAWKQLHNERNVLAEITLLTVFYKFREKGKLCPVLNGSLLHFLYICKRVSSDLMPFLLTSSGQFCDRSVASFSTLTINHSLFNSDSHPSLVLPKLAFWHFRRFSLNLCGRVLQGQMPLSCSQSLATLSHPSSLPIRMPRYGTVRCFLCKETVLSFSQCCCRYLSKTTFGLSRIIHFSPCILATHLSSQQPHSRYNCAILWLRAEPLSPDRRVMFQKNLYLDVRPVAAHSYFYPD
ncbi:hypothetical protein T4D_4262 [Trichinella pseudospiralis]|uniref:Uncharacterized protein n=1 Tax=Trichinella pseudospiralis TaxID=6337 RepID=A0A0V1F4F6_TRIPS|nr:hypothetical protein T4D_4262 [Trichinella pseudospiralis]